MTDPDAVARALARLASGAPRPNEHGPEHPPARVVADAEAAMERVDRAAAFVDAGGEARLRHAVERAQETGDDALAARGRAVLSTLSAFRTAASGGEEPDDSHPAGAGPLPPRSRNALPGRGHNG